MLIGQATLDACAEYIAVDQVAGLQLKGKSAETFRGFKLSAIREDAQSPWVPFPTDAAMASYEEMKMRYRRQSIFATEE